MFIVTACQLQSKQDNILLKKLLPPPCVCRGQQSFYSRSNGLQFVALMSVYFSLFCPVNLLKCLSPIVLYRSTNQSQLAMCASFFSGLKSINDNCVLFTCLFLSVSGDNLIVTIMFYNKCDIQCFNNAWLRPRKLILCFND